MSMLFFPFFLVDGSYIWPSPVDMEIDTRTFSEWLECHQDIATALPRIFEPSTTFLGKFHRDLSPPFGHPQIVVKRKGTYPPKCPRNIQVYIYCKNLPEVWKAINFAAYTPENQHGTYKFTQLKRNIIFQTSIFGSYCWWLKFCTS